MTTPPTETAHRPSRAGSALADRFCHAPDLVYLNHGSFGATPRATLEHQNTLRQELEADAVHFFLTRLEPLLDKTRDAVGPILNLPPEEILFTRNATSAVCAAMTHLVRSLKLGPGDEILTNAHEYAACNSELGRLASQFGFKIVTAPIPFPVADRARVAEAYTSAITDRTRIALISQITSPTALVMPLDEILPVLHDKGIVSVVDGAHGPGQIDVDVPALGCDVYVANLHKWLCAPKSAAVLWLKQEHREDIEPHALSSRAHADRPDRDRARHLFDYIGTDDYTPAMAAWHSIETISAMAPEGDAAPLQRIAAANRTLALTGRNILCDTLGIEPAAPDGMTASMAALLLPGTPPKSMVFSGAGYDDEVHAQLKERFGIQVPVWTSPSGGRVVRISAFLYNTPGQYAELAQALRTLLY